MWRSVAKAAAATAVVASLMLVAVWSVRVGWADYLVRRGTVESTRQALRLVPSQSEYEHRLAVLTAEEDPQASLQALERAAMLNPSDAAVWIELGLRREGAGRLTEAEQHLLRAAEESRLYVPRWTLANFYFRRGDTDRFWKWASAAASMAYDDGVALFRLCGRLTEDGELIERISIRKPEMRAAYLAYLMREKPTDVLMPSVRTLLADLRDAYVPLLLAACDLLLEAGRSVDALEIWNGLAGVKIPFDRLDTGRGFILTNDRFRSVPMSNGFDWRMPHVDGVSTTREDESGGLRITISGQQPENCDILWQYLPVREREQYGVRFHYRTSGIPTGSGLTLRLTAARDGSVLAKTDSLSSDGESRELRFAAPAGSGLVRLTLGYRRAPGTTRIAGFLVLKDMASAVTQSDVAEPPRSRVR
jgi:tetratricopeptide (TPR) repeat protein